jgi:hypothetical protein
MPPSSTNLEVLRGDGDPQDQRHRLDLAIEVLRARVDQEFKITERIDGKGRQAFALVAAFFAVAQAVTFGSFRAASLTSPKLVLLAVLATAAVAFVLLTGHLLADSEELQDEPDVRPASVERWAHEKTDRAFAEKLLVELRDVAEKRHEGNERRGRRYQRVACTARVALILTSVELIFGIAFRA